MGLYKQWEEIAQAQKDQAQYNAFWNEYLEMEKSNYQYILENHLNKLEGRLADLAAKFSMEPIVFAGFLDGINSSLADELELDTLDEDTVLSSEINFEKIYWNMEEKQLK